MEILSAQQPGDAEAWYQLGLAYAQANRTDQAISALQKAVTLNPSHVLAWENLGGNLYDAHRPQDSLDAYQKAIDLGATDPEVWNSYAMILIYVGRLADSDKALEHAFTLAPNSRRLWNTLGILRGNQGRNDEEMKAYQHALQINPTYAVAWNNLGSCQGKAGDMTDAEVSYKNAVRYNPNMAPSWEALSLIYINRKDYADAVPAAEQAIRVQPNDPDGWILMANCAQAAGRFEPAVEYYHRAIDILGLHTSHLQDNHDRALAYAEYGRDCTNIGHYADAEKLLNEAVDIDPTLASGWSGLATLKSIQGKSQEALATAQKAVDLAPNEPTCWDTLGSVFLFGLNDPGKAVPAFQKAVAIQPSYTGAWYGLGRAEQKLMHREEAAQAYRHVVSAAPDDLAAWQGLVATSSDPAEVDHAYATAMALDPKNAGTYGALGSSLTMREDWPAAERALRKSLALDGKNAVNWSLLGSTLFAERRLPEAIEALEKAVQYGATSMPPQQLSVNWGCLAMDHATLAKQKGAPEWKAALDAVTHALAIDPKNSVYWNLEAMCDDALGRTAGAAAARVHWKATGSLTTLIPGLNAPAGIPLATAAPVHIAPSTNPSINASNAITMLMRTNQMPAAYDKALAETVQRPKDPVTWYDLGTVQLQMGHYSDASVNLAKATAIEPKMGPAWFFLGTSLVYQRRFDDAIDAFAQSIDAMPDMAVNWESLVKTYNTRGDQADGVEKLRKLLQKHPDNAFGYCFLGSMEFSLGDTAQGLADLQKAVQLRPDYSVGWNALGLAYGSTGQPDKAIESLRRAVAVDPANVEAWNNLGFDLFTAGKTDEAIAAYQRALRIDPHHLLALYNLAAAYEKQQQWDAARQACNALAQVNPAQATYLRQRIPDRAETPATSPSTIPRGYLQIGPLFNTSPQSSTAPRAVGSSGIPYLDRIGAANLDGYNVMTCAVMILGIVGLVAISFKLNPSAQRKKTGQPIARPPPMKPRP